MKKHLRVAAVSQDKRKTDQENNLHFKQNHSSLFYCKTSYLRFMNEKDTVCHLLICCLLKGYTFCMG